MAQAQQSQQAQSGETDLDRILRELKENEQRLRDAQAKRDEIAADAVKPVAAPPLSFGTKMQLFAGKHQALLGSDASDLSELGQLADFGKGVASLFSGDSGSEKPAAKSPNSSDAEDASDIATIMQIIALF